MAVAKNNYVAGDKVIYSDLNQISNNANKGGGFIDSVNAGETINGTTLPVAVYQDTSDFELYACDADDQTKLNFVGFAISNSTNGNPIQFQGSGVVSGFTGLTKGAYYYVKDDKTLGTTPGTYKVLVGMAISATEILIIKGSDEYMGSASVNPNGSTATTIPTGCKTIRIKCFKNYSGNATNGNEESGGELILKDLGILTVAMNINYMSAVSGAPTWVIRHFRATWSGANLTSKTFSQDNVGTETVDTGYTITAYFYK